jgi:hypothetical protein
MSTFLKTLQDLAVIVLVVASLGGLYAIALWLSVRKTMFQEARVEITRLAGDNRKRIVGLATATVVVSALLAVVTDNLNRGTWTFGQVGWFFFALMAILVVGAVAYSIYKETREPWRPL